MSEHPNNPNDFGPSYGNHTSSVDSRGKKGKDGKIKEFLPSEMAETRAKGISFPKGGRRGGSGGVGPSTSLLVTGNGCETLGIKVTAKGQCVISTPPLTLHGKTQKALNSQKYRLGSSLSPQGISASPRGLGWSWTMPPRSRFTPHVHVPLRAPSRDPHNPRPDTSHRAHSAEWGRPPAQRA